MDDSVKVAVNIRPLITPELLVGCTDCITVVHGEPQVQIGYHAFTYDYVYGNNGSPSSAIYNDCVAPLVDAVFHGYNATVLAYGQTGSGKTYTMGTNYTGEGSENGVIPKVMESIFSRVEKLRESTEFLIRVSFIEIFKEEVFDLLGPNSAILSKGEGGNVAKPTVPARAPIQIRETVNGGITLACVTEAEVRSKEEMASYLYRGSLSRATGSTNMKSQSSRSHAIFTIAMEQKKIVNSSMRVNNEDIGNDILFAKLHLVDLAGSERAKRTGADGMRFKEGIHINKGLLALGNVLSALGDEKKRKEGGHVPYRDSKLTRLLQDSLGGNSKTVMIACVSPANTDAEETLNTLKYASRACKNKNIAIINRDPMAAQSQRMRSQVEQLQAEMLFYCGDGTAPYDEVQLLKHKVSLLEASNAELHREVEEGRITCEHLWQRAVDAQVEKDKLVIQIESARNGKSWDEIDSSENKDGDLVKTYVLRNQELEGELPSLKNLSNSKANRFVSSVDSDDEGFYSKNILFPPLSELSSNPDTKDEVEEKELEHSSLQERLEKELKELEKRLEQKEAEMKRFTSTDTLVLKMHYEKKVHELEQEKRALQKEIEELRNNLANISSTFDDCAPKLKEEYLQKLTVVEVAELKKKEDAQAKLLRQKQKGCEASGAPFRRARMAKEVARLKEEAKMLKQANFSDCTPSMSPGARNSRIFAQENMLAASSSTFVSMASQLSKAEERERGFHGRGRWNQVRSLPEAKSLMNSLFDVGVSSRCLARNKEADCRVLSSAFTHLKTREAELHQLKQRNLASKNDGGHKYELRKQAKRNSTMLDMDIDASEYTKQPAKKRSSRVGETCCTCTKKSLCKTTKCQCRYSGDMCSVSCGCAAFTCSNREAGADHLSPPDTPDIIDSSSDSEKSDKTSSI